MELTRNAEALFQTSEQKTAGAATYRVYLDNAWRNIEGQVTWKNLSQKELMQKLEEAYFTPR